MWSSFLAFFYYGRKFLLSLAWSSRQKRYYGCDRCHTCMPCLTPLLTYKRSPSPPHFSSILGPLACVCYCNSPMHWCWLAHASNWAFFLWLLLCLCVGYPLAKRVTDSTSLCVSCVYGLWLCFCVVMCVHHVWMMNFPSPFSHINLAIDCVHVAHYRSLEWGGLAPTPIWSSVEYFRNDDLV